MCEPCFSPSRDQLFLKHTFALLLSSNFEGFLKEQPHEYTTLFKMLLSVILRVYYMRSLWSTLI